MGKPLLAVIRDLALDPAEKAAFEAAPTDYLGRHGHEGVTPDDLREAVSLAADTMDPEVAQAIAPPEGGDTDVLETLQRVTNAAPGVGPEPAPGDAAAGPETPAETTGSDLAFGSGSSVESLDDVGVEPVETAEVADTEGSEAEDLAFDQGTLTDDPLAEDEFGGLDDSETQSAEDFTDQMPDPELDIEIDDVGAF